MAPVVEAFFIADVRRRLPRIADETLRAEGDAFLRQEAAHATMHAAFKRLLMRWGVPVDPVADSVLGWLAIVDWTSSDLRSAVAMAGEHFLGEIGHALLSRPELLEGVDPRISGCSGGMATRKWTTRRCSSTCSTPPGATVSTPTPFASPDCGSPSSSS
jgi:predicted metal-dependent hydrolase